MTTPTITPLQFYQILADADQQFIAELAQLMLTTSADVLTDLARDHSSGAVPNIVNYNDIKNHGAGYFFDLMTEFKDDVIKSIKEQQPIVHSEMIQHIKLTF